MVLPGISGKIYPGRMTQVILEDDAKGFWSLGYKGSKACHMPTEEEILAAYKGIQAASEVMVTEAQPSW